MNGWDSAVKQVSGVWQLDGLAGRLKPSNAAGISGIYGCEEMPKPARRCRRICPWMGLIMNRQIA